MKFILLFLILVSCGKVRVGVETTPIAPIQATFGPDFEKAIEVCEGRYGKGSPDAEACFLDYRHFLSPSISIDLSNISDICRKRYTDPVAIATCESDMIAIFSKK